MGRSQGILQSHYIILKHRCCGVDVEACSSQVFGVDPHCMTNKDQRLSIILQWLLENVELNGFCTEGFYCKFGAVNRVSYGSSWRRMSQWALVLFLGRSSQNCSAHFCIYNNPVHHLDPQALCLEDHTIHTVTGLIKEWLQKLPESLMTFMHYSALLHAMTGEADLPHGQGGH
nr:unconventional myosin-IXb-like [Paramormyrops kingsleyae]